MVRIRRSGERGSTRMGWLQSWHSFSFNRYHDPAHVHFGPLLVLNDDIVAPASGFDTHPHQNMEIVTCVLEGAVAHRDSTGADAIIRAGEVQRMTAGTGVRHSEHNPSGSEPLHLLQVWFLPDRNGYAPSYEQKAFDAADRKDALLAVASGRGDAGALAIHQDLTMYIATLAASRALRHNLAEGRGAYLFLISGTLDVNGAAIAAGDAAMVTDEIAVDIAADSDADFVLFDLPMTFQSDYRID